MDQRLTPPWHPWEAVPVALGAVAAATVAAVLFTTLFGSIGGPALLLTGLAFEVALAGCTLAWVAVRHRGWLPALGLRSARPEREVPVGGFIGVALYGLIRFVVAPAVVLAWQAVTGRPPAMPTQLAIDFGPVEIVLGLVLLVLAAPVAEEIFFRGFLFAGLRRRFGFWVGASISAVLFGLSHAGDGAVLVPLLFVFGVGAAYLYDRRGSLVAPIAAHAMFNVIGFAELLMGQA
jgi:membrane protease YdiL (CAAX protease family)